MTGWTRSNLPTCPICQGVGTIPMDVDGRMCPVICLTCDGIGRISDEKRAELEALFSDLDEIQTMHEPILSPG